MEVGFHCATGFFTRNCGYLEENLAHLKATLADVGSSHVYSPKFNR
jgi:hypothetical protein